MRRRSKRIQFKPRDFPDRAIREMNAIPENLKDIVTEAIPPALASRLDFDRAREVKRSFLQKSWLRRESDLLVEIPYLLDDGLDQSIIVCILLEHQSTPDRLMPLRVLIYEALYWERSLRQWEANHEPHEPFTLTPMLPIVMYTGHTAWRAPRTLQELAPPEFRAYIPRWTTVFWNLSELTTEALLEKTAAWLNALAVVRAEQEGPGEFLETFERVMQSLENVENESRWHDLAHFVLSWAYIRRDPTERQQVVEMAEVALRKARHQREVIDWSKVLPGSYQEQYFRGIEKAEQEASARGEARGEALGEARGEALGEARAARRLLLTMGTRLLGEPDTLAREAIEMLPSLDVVEEMVQRLPDVHSWGELLSRAD